MSDWDDYLTATRRLDSVRREAASVAVAGTETVREAREELATVRQRLDRQRSLLLALAGPSGPMLPGAPIGTDAGSGLRPVTETQADAGDEAGAGTNGTGLRALRAATAHLDAADAILSGLGRPDPGDRPPVRRNALVYGSFAVVVLAIQLTLFGTLKDTVASKVATAAGAVLPLVGFGLSWLLIGLVFGRAGRRPGALGRLLGTSRGLRGALGGIVRAPGLALRAGGRILGGQRGRAQDGGTAAQADRPLSRHADARHIADAGRDVPGLDHDAPAPGAVDPRSGAGDASSGRVDRTPLLGAAISLAPVVVLCAGLGTAALLR